jgi:hypothetical protein
VGQGDERRDVQLDHRGHSCGICVDEIPAHAEAGVVDQGVDPDAPPLQFVTQFGRRLGACQIHRDRCGRDAVAITQLARELDQAVLTACDEHDVRPAGGEGVGEGGTDTGARAGDQGGGGGEVDGHDRHTRCRRMCGGRVCVRGSEPRVRGAH